MADFNLNEFMDGLNRFGADVGRTFNPFNPENQFNRDATAAWQGSALGKALGGVQSTMEGGVTAPDNRPWTAQEIDEFVSMARSQGLNDQQIQMFLDNTAGAQGRGQNPWNRDIAQQHIANALNQNKTQALIDTGDADLTTYINDLDRQENEEFGALNAQRDRFSGLIKDPNTIKTDAEYGAMLRQAEQRLQGTRTAARNQGASISASRGSGFSGAGLGLVANADAGATRDYGNLESNMFSDIVGRRDAIDKYAPERRSSYSSARAGARTANAGFKANLTGSQLGANTDFWRNQYGDSIAPRQLQQSESERGFNQYIVQPGMHLSDQVAGIAGNAANQVGGLVKK